MSEDSLSKLLAHPDREELVSKLILDYDPDDISKWLSEKYSSVSEKKFVLSSRALKYFKKNHLNIYKTIQEDLQKTRIAVANSEENSLELSVDNLPAYKKTMLEAAHSELDIRAVVKRLCIAIETRFAQVFDEIQEDPKNINTRIDRVLIEYTTVLGNILEKYYKFTEAPDNISVTNNITLQAVDQHISVFHDVMRDVLAEMDFDVSLHFIEKFNERFSALKSPDGKVSSSKERLVEAEILNEEINKKLNG